jgi:hypothetical protein
MDHAAAQRAYPLERERHVGHGEIRQRCRVARPGAARMDPDRGPRAARLTPGALALEALLEAVIEQLFPEAARPLGVIRGEFDQRQARAGHAPNATARSSTIGHVQTRRGRTRAAPRRPRHRRARHRRVGRRAIGDRRAAALIAWPARHAAPRTGEVLTRLQRHGWTLKLPDPAAATQSELWASARLPASSRRAPPLAPFEGHVDRPMR